MIRWMKWLLYGLLLQFCLSVLITKSLFWNYNFPSYKKLLYTNVFFCWFHSYKLILRREHEYSLQKNWNLSMVLINYHLYIYLFRGKFLMWVQVTISMGLVNHMAFSQGEMPPERSSLAAFKILHICRLILEGWTKSNYKYSMETIILFLLSYS